MSDESKAVVMSFSPSFYAAMREQADFEAGMIQLASLLPYPVEKVSEAFRRWAGPNPLPWRVALDYCLDRAKTGKSLPFTVEAELTITIDEFNEGFRDAMQRAFDNADDHPQRD